MHSKLKLGIATLAVDAAPVRARAGDRPGLELPPLLQVNGQWIRHS